MADIDKLSSLLQYRTDYGRKTFYSTGSTQNVILV
jgi:hypothetical protein